MPTLAKWPLPEKRLNQKKPQSALPGWGFFVTAPKLARLDCTISRRSLG